MSPSDSSFMKVGRYGLTFKSFFMWSRFVDLAHQPLTIISVLTSLGNVQWKWQLLHVSKCVVFLPLRGLSFTLPRVNAHFSQSSSVILRGGALLNCSQNAAITWDMVCPVCRLSCTRHQALLDWVTVVSAIWKIKLNSVAAANHVCTILHTVAKLPFYIVLCAVLCCVNLYWVWGVYCLGVQWLLTHSVYSSIWTIITYDNTQTCGNPHTCFGLFQPSSGRY